MKRVKLLLRLERTVELDEADLIQDALDGQVAAVMEAMLYEIPENLPGGLTGCAFRVEPASGKCKATGT